MHIYIFLLIGLTLSFGSLAAPQVSNENKHLRIGLLGKIDTLHPLFMQNDAERFVYFLTAHPLAALNGKWQWQCFLCTQMPTLENGLIKKTQIKNHAKKLAITWQIHPTATWGDGKPVTGHDAVFAWQVGKSRGVRLPDPRTYVSIERVVVDPADPKTFTMFFRDVRYEYLKSLDFYLLPKHLEIEIFSSSRDTVGKYREETNFARRPESPGLFNGP